MKRFTSLFRELDDTTRTLEKTDAMRRYFQEAPARDAAWGLWFLLGETLPRSVTTRQLREWAAVEAGLPDWLFEECYEAVGDLAETVRLVLPPTPSTETDPSSNPGAPPLHVLVEQQWQPLVHLPVSSRHDRLRQIWRCLEGDERLVFNKLLTGHFRVGVARTLVARALAHVAGTSQAVMLHRLMGTWRPTEGDYRKLIAGETAADHATQPYPFYLASPLEADPESLSPLEHWQIEWKWDGIRAQLIRRGEQVLLWSRGEELVTETFPEVAIAARLLPEGTVLDGELLAWRENAPLPFADLQKRLGRKTVGPKILTQVPVTFMAYDLLEQGGRDCRQEPLHRRRDWMIELLADWEQQFPKNQSEDHASGRTPSVQSELAFMSELTSAHRASSSQPTLPLQLSPLLPCATWEDVQNWQNQARQQGTEGVMIKERHSPYGVGRQRGAWWKWKVDPFTIDAVLVAAQPGHGRRASLFTDYTFALWNDQADELITVAKAYSGLTDQEIKKVDAFVRQNTTQRFGPVRGVKSELVFELAFEGVRPSPRHKAGLALRFPRIHRWRHDKKPEEADNLERLQALLKPAP